MTNEQTGKAEPKMAIVDKHAEQFEQLELVWVDMNRRIIELENECRLLRRWCIAFTLIVPMVLIVMLVQ